MAIEIERKFLVVGNDWREAIPTRICQGYLNRDKGRTVRIRIAGEQAYLTIKGNTCGATRAEFEYEIPLVDAEQLLSLCEKPVIQKLRRLISYCGNTWEVDEFQGENTGLVVAEIELESEDQEFSIPSWIGREVTEDPRYFNSNLVNNPYCMWYKQSDSNA
jgi:CYTH domain-containing protein